MTNRGRSASYLTRHGTRTTPQHRQAREDQTLNEAGGYVFQVDEWERMKRFLILGTEGGSYYASEFKATDEAATAVRKCIKEDGIRTVNEIVRISDLGLAPKNDPALFALACAISLGDKETKRAAAEALPQVARIGTHLYHFVAYAETMRGWGRTMRWAVSNWYDKNPEQLALQAVKYRQRDGWSHRDLLRLAHPVNAKNAEIFDWLTSQGTELDATLTYPLIQGFELAQRSASAKETADLVRQYNLPREALQTEHLNSPEVWEALLFAGKYGMPITALIRNIATMTRIGLLTPGSEATKYVREAVTDQDRLTHGRVHPMQLLIGCRTYALGRGIRGSHTWGPITSIVDALNDGFYLAFGNLKPTGKRMIVAIDSSGSMHGSQVNGVPGLTAGEAGCAMALIFVAADPDTEVILFDTNVSVFPLSPKMRLDTLYASWSRNHGGGTNCALPFAYARKVKRKVDAFVTLTDAQTWYGRSHPFQELMHYRNEYGNARYVEAQMVANKWSTADEFDQQSLRIIGLDAAAPGLASGFIKGEF